MTGRMFRSVVLAAFVGALLAFGVPVGPGAGTAPAGAAEAGRTMVWGAYSRPASGQSERQAVEALEGVAGRKFGVVRVFTLWDEAFPSSYELWLRDTGRTPIISVRAKTVGGTLVSFRSIADAQPGSATYQRIVTWAQRIKAYGSFVHLTFNHEPEADASVGNGTAADFIAAWRRWVEVFRQQGVTNAEFMWIMTEHAFQVSSTDRRYGQKWYPGDDWVDHLGADAYNDYTCRGTTSSPWKTLAEDIEGFRRFGLLHPQKGMWLAEWASAPDPADPTRRPAWIDQAAALFKQSAYAQFRGVSYFNSYRPGTPCLWTLTQDASAKHWSAMGLDPFYAGVAGPAAPLPPPPPPSSTAVMLVVQEPIASGDVVLRDRLGSRGFTPTVVDDDAFTAAGAAGSAAVLVSSTVDDQVVGPKLVGLAVPVVTWKPWLYDDLRIVAAGTASYGLGRGTSIVVTDPAHPLAAGLSGTVAITTTTENISWGVPTVSGRVAATTTDGKAALFSVASGAALTGGGTAPSCRAALPLHTKSALSLTAAGGRLFDNAVDWAVACAG